MRTPPSIPPRSGFTLMEMLVTSAILLVLTALVVPAVKQASNAGANARCANSLRQLGAATQMYLADNQQKFFPYYEDLAEGGRRWYFGLEKSFGQNGTEGSREIDTTQSPLYPYLQSVRKIEICPAFPYGSDYWKPKFKGASFGYGYNIYLSPIVTGGGTSKPVPISALTLPKPSAILLFGDCAQINTFQAPASASNPMLEEFYFIDETSKTVHFRHGGLANMLFVDGHVEAFRPWPGTADRSLPGQTLGRITAKRSTEYLK